MLQFADRLRSAGHIVHTPDLYDGEIFDDPAKAANKVQYLGFDEILARSQRAVLSLPTDLVYAGFSNGGACAELLAATRPGARAAILMHAPLPIRSLGWDVWPAGCPVQVHFAERDSLRNQPVIDALAVKVRQSGASFEQHDYPGSGHVFIDPGRPGYSEAASEQMFNRVRDFVERVPPVRG